jgi:hypothetical protein
MYELDSAAAVLRGFQFEKLLALGFERGEGARFVLAHESAVADDVGGKDRRKPTFLALFHRNPSFPERGQTHIPNRAPAESTPIVPR